MDNDIDIDKLIYREEVLSKISQMLEHIIKVYSMHEEDVALDSLIESKGYIDLSLCAIYANNPDLYKKNKQKVSL